MRLAAIVISCAVGGACHERAAVRTDGVVVPLTHDTFKLDGELDEPDWNRRGHPKSFVGHDGREARPYSQVRLLHDGANLYVGLYAADQDIVSADKFEVTIGAIALAVNAAGEVSPALPGVHAGHDLDGTLDRSSDEDEEWVIELAVPLVTAGLRHNGPPVPFTAKRCDTPKDGVTRCGDWSAKIVLEGG